MEGHTWIYVITILIYLWHLSKVMDGNKQLMIRRSRIHEPQNKGEEFGNYIHTLRKFQGELKQFRVRAFGIFFLIPVVETLFHFVLGNYQINGVLLSVSFLMLFFVCLMLILFALNGKESRVHGKKYTRSPDLFID